MGKKDLLYLCPQVTRCECEAICENGYWRLACRGRSYEITFRVYSNGNGVEAPFRPESRNKEEAA